MAGGGPGVSVTTSMSPPASDLVNPDGCEEQYGYLGVVHAIKIAFTTQFVLSLTFYLRKHAQMQSPTADVPRYRCSNVSTMDL